MASRVLNRTALARPFFSTATFAGNIHGFVYASAAFSTVDVAGARGTQLTRIKKRSGHGRLYRRPDWATQPHWAMSSSLCDRSAEE
jgi:hypothetical protein